MTSIEISQNVTKISDEAFRNCTNLRDITIPQNVTEIGIGTFLECKSLTSITIPDSVKKIKEFAFSQYIKDINLYSYNVFHLLDENLKLIAISSTIRNYYTGKIKYCDEDMNLFKKYIRKNKYNLFEYAKETVELVNFMMNDMEENFITQEDATNLINQTDENNAEIRAILLNYINEKFGVDIEIQRKNRLDEYDLGNFEEVENEDLGKTR